ncbi:YadA-like family protein, partial [Herbiconiux daphne]|uniref:YadA-like family protein n=1 Tax=Herbiconiux daphne TaxID=2970914 RepID=UPI0038B2C9DE
TWNVGAGVGQYADASAVAVGANYRVSEHVAFKVGVTATPTTQNYGAFAGVSIGN